MKISCPVCAIPCMPILTRFRTAKRPGGVTRARGLLVERDLHIKPTRLLSEYTIAARAARRIVDF